MKVSTRFGLVLSSALLIGSVSALAAPTPVGEIATKTVKFADLDISTAAGAEALYERIKRAASVVCRDAGLSLVVECQTKAIADAVSGVGSPLLSSVHRSTIDRVEEVVRR